MSELRERMVADMRSQGLSASTQEVYLQGVKGLAAYYRRSPDQLDEKDVRRYLLYLRDERGVARGTFTPHQGGIRFLFAHTLDRDWSLFLKKSPPAEEEAFAICFVGRGSAPTSWPAAPKRSADTSGAATTAAPKSIPIIPAKTGATRVCEADKRLPNARQPCFCAVYLPRTSSQQLKFP